MHDIRVIRDNPAAFDVGLARRHLPPQSAIVLEIDRRRRAAITEGEQAQARRKALSREIGALRGKGESADAQMAEVAALDTTQKTAEAAAAAAEKELHDLLSGLPNLPSEQTPDGKDEHDNVPVPQRQSGAPRNFAFEPRDHVSIGEKLGMDFAAATKLSGARFVVLRSQLARLERAIGQFMIDLQTTENGYTEIAPPLLVRDAAVYGTNNLPKFAEDLFRTENGYWLIPTAEVPLTNLAADTIFEEKDLPQRYTALTPCFRSEAGSAGKDTRGMIRQHQFTKVELVSIVTPEQSADEHERMTDCAQSVLKKLELPHQVVTLCAGDMGFGARKTYDIEVWLPGQGRYREISSCSNMGDFQARRMGARYRPKEGKGNRFVHTLNGSGLAVGRTLVAILENFQSQDGSVTVPDALRSYMGGVTTLSPQ
ncbi:MAG: serine--tRNA ligase [Alphaproteobacteria bacterium]|nr:serine--tRNA ligase [Alphaproteobacteria bacterium]MCW5743072.1 serine--tRNA ligase [Alphaproteobacteria bacterium]